MKEDRFEPERERVDYTPATILKQPDPKRSPRLRGDKFRAPGRLIEKGFVTRFRMRLVCKEGSAKPPQVCLLHIEDGFLDPDAADQDAVEIAVEVRSRSAAQNLNLLERPVQQLSFNRLLKVFICSSHVFVQRLQETFEGKKTTWISAAMREGLGFTPLPHSVLTG